MDSRSGAPLRVPMRELVEGKEWASTPLGPRDAWPESLRTAVAICLGSRFPTCVWWGGELVLVYNDGYREILGDKHPQALGRPAREVWPEIWEQARPLFEGVMRGGDAVWYEDQDVVLRRGERDEGVWLTFSLSPVPDGRGGVGGVFNTAVETTARVRAERELLQRESGLDLLHRVRGELEKGNDREEALAKLSRAIGEHFDVARCGFVEAEGEGAGGEAVLARGWRHNGGGDADSAPVLLQDFPREECLRFPRSGVELVVPDAAGSSGGAAAGEPTRTRSFLAAPYLEGNQWQGALVVADDRPRDWSGEDRALMQELSRCVGASLRRARDEEALRESEARYRTLYESLDESYAVSEILYDDEGRPVDYRFLEANRAFQEVTGLGDPVGKTARELVPDVEPHWIENLAAIAETGEPRRWSAEVRALGRWYDNYGYRFGEAAERKVAVISQDITAYKRAERTLQGTATRQAYMLRLNDALRSLTDPVAIQEVACRVLGDHLDVEWVLYSELDLEREVIVNTRDFHRGGPEGEVPSHVGEFDLNAYPTHARAWRAGWSLAVEDVETDSKLGEGERARLLRGSVRATLTTPLLKGERPVVVMSALSQRPRPWSAEDVALLEETAERTWSAAERARAEAALQRLNERLEARVAERTREVRRLAETLSRTEQAERQRLSHLLHDDLQQLLFGIQMKLGGGRNDLKSGRADAGLAAVERSIDLLEDAITRTRQLTVELSPPVLAGEGLMEALEWLRGHAWDLHRLRVEIRGGLGGSSLPPDQSVLLFQVVRELLFNVAKHAGTDRAAVEVEHAGDRIRVVVSDRGRGFDAAGMDAAGEARGGHGLASARERLRMRGGSMSVEAVPGEGTRVELHMPSKTP